MTKLTKFLLAPNPMLEKLIQEIKTLTPEQPC